MIVKIDLADLYTPQGLLPRVITGTIPEKVEEYAEMIKNGVEFDPILVWKNPKDGKYWIIDGNHRYLAHQKAGKTYLQAKLKDLKDEKEFRKEAIKANLKHGIPLKPKEKLINARILYQDGTPIDEIALIFGVSERTINNWIKDLIDEKKHQKEELKRKALELKEQGLTVREIAKEIGVDHSTIVKWFGEKMKIFKNSPTTPQDLAIQLHDQGLRYEEIQQKILEETGQEIPINTLQNWVAEHKGKLWDATGWGKPAQEETQPEEYEEPETEEYEEQAEEYEEETEEYEEQAEEYEEEPQTDSTTEEIKQIISQMRKQGYNKFQIVKYLVDGEDIDGYTFDQIAKAFDTDAQSIEELYNEALEMNIRTPRPYQKGKTGRPRKDTSTAFNHEAQFEEIISQTIDILAKDIYDISLRWGRKKAEVYIARIIDWLQKEGHLCIDRNAK